MSATFSQRIGGAVPTVLTLLILAGVGWWGHATGWSAAPLASTHGAAPHEDWCVEHGVPESTCLWCKKPLMKAMIAKEPAAYRSPEEDIRFAQVASEAVLAKVGITTATAAASDTVPTLSALGETVYDQTKVARLGSRLPGTVRMVLKRLGDPVAADEVVAVIESAAVGKAKSDLLRALTEQAATAAAAARAAASAAGGFRSLAEAQEADARLRGARVGVVDAEQALLNLGFLVSAADLAALDPAEWMTRLRTLGLPDGVAGQAGVDRSANLLPIRAPQAGTITEIHAVPGETVDAGTALVVIANSASLWLTMAITVEDAARVAPGRVVHFTTAGGRSADGTVSVIAPAADDTSRLVTVFAQIDNRMAGLRAHQVGTATIIVGDPVKGVLLPAEALQYYGATAYVFVRRSPTIFRGLAVPVLSRSAAGVTVGRLLPGAEVAVTGTAMLKGNLFQDKFGADDD